MIVERYNRVSDATAQPILVAFRFGVLGLCILIAVLFSEMSEVLLPLAMLVALAGMASVPLNPPGVRRFRPIFEAIFAAAIITSGTEIPEALLPYFLVPPVVAAIEAGVWYVLATVAASVATILASAALVTKVSDPGASRSIAEWCGLSLLTGLAAAWARSQRFTTPSEANTYRSAHQLLRQLRDVARELPTGLDEVSLGQRVLSNVESVVEFDIGVVYGVSEEQRLTPLAVRGADRVSWDLEIDDDLWRNPGPTLGPRRRSGSFTDRTTGFAAVVPLNLGDVLIGLVAFESTQDWSTSLLNRAGSISYGAALQLDSGQLFSEVRAMATTEERRRLAREIHDGIAQEIASLGYVVDEIAAGQTDPESRLLVEGLRGELTRIVSELRLSIFDLRSDVQPTNGLGATLSAYVRQIGTTSGLTVHLVLDESTTRLGIEAETEFLRIAQEAVTNARRHSKAKNLWVTCRVNPPNAFLRVADDGGGLGSPRIDSYGLDIMRERAQRLGAQLNIRDRVGGGTVVELVLGDKNVRAGRISVTRARGGSRDDDPDS